MKKRICSLMLALVMLLSLCPVAALAEEPEEYTGEPVAAVESMEAEPVAEPTPEPEAEPTEAAEEPAEEPEAEPAPEPTAEPTEAPATETETETETETATEAEAETVDKAVAAVEALIAALPDVDAVSASDYDAAQDAADAFYALSEAQQEQVANLARLVALMEWFNAQVTTLDTSWAADYNNETVFEISDAADLAGLAQLVNNDSKDFEGRTVKLTADIDLSAHEWTPIGGASGFKGTFDGDNHTISNLSVNTPVLTSNETAGYAGLFGALGQNAAVKNVTVKGSVTVTSEISLLYAGGIAGGAKSGTTITNCHSSVTVAVENTSSAGGQSYAGGIVGSGWGTTVTGCANTGKVEATAVSGNAYAGGIVGQGTTVDNCYSNAAVSATKNGASNTDYLGGIAGTATKITNCCYLKNTNYQGVGTSIEIDTSTVTAVSAEAFSSGEVAWLLNGSTAEGTPVWKQSLGTDSAPTLTGSSIVYKRISYTTGEMVYTNTAATEHSYGTDGICTDSGCTEQYQPATLNNGVYEIGNAGQLYWFAGLVNGTLGGEAKYNANAKLTADIELGGSWTPIGGNDAFAFTGSFDGDNHTIYQLYISCDSASAHYYAGLFGKLGSGAVVKNVTVAKDKAYGLFGGITVKLNQQYIDAGAIAGYATGATITNCHSSIPVTVTNTSTSTSSGRTLYAGGIVGNAQSTTITGCSNSGTITATGVADDIVKAGGIAGYCYSISKCWNTGKATTSAVSGNSYTGGIAGQAITASYSYSTGEVTASSSLTRVYSGKLYCGGVVGNVGTITSCYSNAKVTATADGGNYTYYRGGLAGEVGSKITNCVCLESSQSYSEVYNPVGASTSITAGVTALSTSDFSSGKATWLLNGSTAEGELVWFQTCGKDLPAYSGKTVCYNASTGKYYNPCTTHKWNTDGSGVCTVCGLQMEAAVARTEGEGETATTTTDYYSTIAAAVAAAGDGDTVTLLSSTKTASIDISNKTVTLDLNGKTLTVFSIEPATEEGGDEVEYRGSISVGDDGNLTLKNGTVVGGIGTYGGEDCVHSVTLNAVVLTSDDKGGGILSVGDGECRAELIVENGSSVAQLILNESSTLTATLKAGTSYGKIDGAGYVTLPSGCAFQHTGTDTSMVKRAEIVQTLENVKVVECTDHNTRDDAGACIYCGETCAHASIETDSTTGKTTCSTCGAEFVAKLVKGSATSYATAAEMGSWMTLCDESGTTAITLLADATVSGAVERKIELDLNGHTLSSAGDLVFTADSTITGSGKISGGSMFIGNDDYTATAKVTLSGTVEYPTTYVCPYSTANISGGTFGYLKAASIATVTLSGGTFEDITVDLSGPTAEQLKAMLAPGYAFYTKDATPIALTDVKSKNNYTVKTCESHSVGTDGGECIYCGSTFVAKIGSNCYTTFNAAYDAAQSGDTITLLADEVWFRSSDKYNPEISKSITIDLNGKTLIGRFTYPTETNGSVGVSGDNVEVTIRGGGTIGGDGLIIKSGTLTLDGVTVSKNVRTWYSGKLIVKDAEIKNTLSVGLSSGSNNGTLTMSGGSAKELTVYSGSSATLTGGTFDKVTNGGGTVGSLLADGYGFKTTGATTTWYDQYNNSDATSIDNVTVTAAPITSVSISTTDNKTSFPYGDGVTLTASAVEDASYQWYTVSADTEASIDDETGADYSPATLSVGTYTFRVRVTKDGYTKAADATVTVTKALAAIVNDPAGATAIYDGKDQKLLSFGGSTDSGTVYYSLDSGEEKTWSADIPTAKNAGDYTVYYYVAGDENHTDSAVASVAAKIEPRKLTSESAADSPLVFCTQTDTLTYNGSAQTPTFKLELKPRAESGASGAVESTTIETLVEGEDYTVSVTPQTNAGEAYGITFTGTGNYTGEATRRWSIAKADAPTGVTATETEIIYTDTPYTVDLSQAITGIPTDAGTVSYSVSSSDTVSISGNTLAISDMISGTAGASIDVPVIVSSANYADVTVTVTVKLVDKVQKTLAVTMTGWTYGEEANKPRYTTEDNASGLSIQSKVKGADDSTYSTVMPTEAGDYTVRVSYETKTEKWSGTADFTIAKAQQTVTAADVTVTYGDKNKSVSASGIGAVTYAVTAGDDVVSVNESTGALTILKAGSATVTATAAGDSNHQPGTATLTVTVDKRSVSVIFIWPSINLYTYTGGEIQPVFDVIADVNGRPVSLKKGTDYTVTYSNNINAGFNTGSVTASPASSGNYIFEPKTEYFTIAKADQTITAPDDAEITAGTTVDISAWATVAGVAGGSAPGALSYELVEEKEGVSLSDEDQLKVVKTVAGGTTIDIKVSAAGTQNYEYAEQTFTVTVKAAPKATVDTLSPADGLIYNATAQKLIADGTATGGTVQYSLSETTGWGSELPEATDADIYTVYYKAVGDDSHLDSDVDSVTVAIGKSQADYVRDPEAKTALTYTGAAQALIAAAGVKDGFTIPDCVFYYKLGEDGTWTTDAGEIKGTDAGEYSIYWYATGGKNYVDCGSAEKANTVTARIATKNITGAAITLGSSLTYTGAEQSQPVESVKLGGEDVTYSVTGNTGTNAGSYTLTVTGTGNYSGTATKTWTIAQAPLQVTAVTAENKTYDKTATATASVTLAGLVGGETLERGVDYTVSAAFDSAGAGVDKTVTVAVTLLNSERAKNYTLETPTATAKATIEKVTPTISAATASVVYGQPVVDGDIQANAGGIAGSFTWMDVTDYGDATETAKTLYARFTPTDAENYNTVENIEVSVTVAKADSALTSHPLANQLTYTGEAQALIAAGAATGGTLEYSLDNDSWSADIPTGTDAGGYTVYYRVKGDANHNDLPSSVTLQPTIAKAALTVTAKPHAITYGDAPANGGVEYSGFVNGETESVLGGTLVYDYSYTQYGGVGSYTITPKGLTSDNYTIAFHTGTLTVAQKEIGIDWTNTALIFNGSEQKPTATATGLVNGDACAITVTGGKTNAGDHTATASALENGNYKLPEGNTTAFSIAKAPAQTLAGETRSIKYADAGEKTVDLSAKMPANAGALSYAVGTITGEAAETIRDAKVDADGELTFVLDAGESDVNKTAVIPVVITSENYEPSTVSVTVVVEKREIPQIELNDQDFKKTYDGKPVDLPKENPKNEKGETIPGEWKWEKYDPDKHGGPAPMALDASLGIMTLALDGDTPAVEQPVNVADSKIQWVLVFTPNDPVTYAPVIQTVNVVIEKRSLTASSKDVTGEYNGSELTNGDHSIVFDGMVDGEQFHITFTGGQTHIGSSDNSFELASTGTADLSNYDINYDPGTLRVTVPADTGAAVKDVTKETVTSDDSEAVQETLNVVNQYLEMEPTAEEKQALEALKAELEDVAAQLENAESARTDDAIENAEEIDASNAKPSDKTTLTEAKDAIEKALEDFGANYTAAEKKELTDKLEQIESALKAIEKTERTEQKKKAAQTGDNAMPVLYIVVIVLALGAIVVLVVVRRKKK